MNYYKLGLREALAIADYACGDLEVLNLIVLGQKVIEKRCFCHKSMRSKRAATIPV